MSNKPNNKPKFSKISKILLSSILLIFCCALFSASFILQDKLEERLNEIDGLQFGKITVPWTCQDVHLSDFSFDHPTESDQEKNTSTCNSISVSGINWWRLWKDNKVIIDELTFEDGASRIFKSNTKKDTTSSGKNPEIFIKKIHFENMSFSYQESKKFEFEINNFNGEFSEVNFQQSKKRIQYKNIAVQAGDGHFKETDGSYRLEWDSLKYGPNENKLNIRDLSLLPIYSKEDWSNHFEHKKSRLNLTTAEINLFNFDLQTLLYQKKIYADSLIVDHASLDVLIDNREEPCSDCYKPLFHETLHQLKLPVLIPNILLKNNEVNLEVKSKQTEDTGKLSFKNIYASLYNVGNSDSQKIHVDLNTDFMDKSRLSLKIDFDLTAPDYPYTVSGDLAPFDLTLINRFFYLTKRATIKSGHCSKLAFDFDGDNNLAEGSLIFEYSDLKLELLDKKDDDPKKLLSILINKLGIISKNNPSDKKYRKGVIYMERLNNKGMFGLWWSALQSGLKSVILPDLLLPKEIEAKEF